MEDYGIKLFILDIVLFVAFIIVSIIGTIGDNLLYLCMGIISSFVPMIACGFSIYFFSIYEDKNKIRKIFISTIIMIAITCIFVGIMLFRIMFMFR